jgi:hypothetical protein
MDEIWEITFALLPNRLLAALPGASRPGVKHSRSSWMPPRIWTSAQ